MNTSLGFGGRYALYAMAAGFELQPTINAVAADFGDHFFKAAVLAFVGAHDFHAPTARFRVTAVHTEQIAREQRRFIAAGTGANFNKRVTLVVRVFRQQQNLQLLLHLFTLLFRFAQLFLRHFAHFRVIEHHLRGFDIIL